MKKFFRFIGILIILAVVGLGGFFAYMTFFVKAGNEKALNLVPHDAIYIIETSNLTEGWETLRESEVWKNLTRSEYYKDIESSANTMDSLIRNNQTMKTLLKDRLMLISTHMISGVDYDYLFVIDLQEISKYSFLTDFLENNITGQYNYKIDRIEHQKYEIIELTHLKGNDKIYISLFDNLLACSFNPGIMERVIEEADTAYWEYNANFQEVNSQLSSRGLFKVYYNFSMVEKFVRCFIEKPGKDIKTLSNILQYSALDFKIEDEVIKFDGYTNINDSLPSYLKALSQTQPLATKAHKIISDQMAFYLSLSFESFNNFLEQQQKVFSHSGTETQKGYVENIEKFEKLLKIDLQENFFSWIGHEIAFVKLRPTQTTDREEDVIIIFHTNDIEKSKNGLSHISRQIKRRTPAKFEAVTYRDFVINYLHLKGFFKLFLGNFFEKLEKPFYTHVEDFVVFSNSPENLKRFINDYLEGQTLANKESYMNFMSTMNKESNISIFVQMPKVYSLLYFYSNKEKQKGMHKNKEVILSFSNVGFQMIREKDGFKTLLYSGFDPDAIKDDQLEIFNKAPQDTWENEIVTLTFRVDLTNSEVEIIPEETQYIEAYYENGAKKYEGKIVAGKPEGLFRSYYPSGNIQSAVYYVDGKIHGNAIFYYDNIKHTVKAEMNFEDEKIDGPYREYHISGARKALIMYKDGIPHGDAEYYYNNGGVKVTGKYSKGAKSGKWKYYTEEGRLFEKKRQ